MLTLNRATATLAAAFVVLVGVAHAQTTAPATGGGAARPKVCLVLSGGGARGAAHVGVLRVLEEYRVPIDCIAGTSMGAVVGGAYASGMSVAQMEKLIDSLTLDVLFREQPPREERLIRRKREDVLNLFSPQIGVTDEGNVSFAKGIVSGVQLETYLREIARVKGSVDFDKLPVPFRAVATDLVTGQPKIFDRGEVALAMRASMSVPGAIAPAEFDGMMLVDGGLVNNLPVDIARGMGADIVIAVNLGTPLSKREAITDVLAITGQMIAILTEQNVQETLNKRLGPSDILILPELGDFTAGDFDNMRKTFPIGEAAARKVAARLRELSLPPDQYAAMQASRTAPIVRDARPIDEITFAKMRRVNPDYLASLLETEPGEPIDPARLDADLRRLYGTEDFEHVSYRLIETPAKLVLNIQAVEKSWGPNYVKFGLGLSSDFTGDAYFNVLGQYRRTWMDANGAEWRTDLVLGRNTQLATEYYQPLDSRQSYFVAPRLQLERFYLNVYRDRDRISEYSLPTAVGGIDLGTQLTRYLELRLGAFAGVTRPELHSGLQLIAEERSTTLGGLRFQAYFDQLDNAFFPRRGIAGDLLVTKGLKALGSDFEYDVWEGSLIAAHTIGRHTLSFVFRGSGPISGERGPLYVATPWGGFLQQSGFGTGQLLNERFAFGRLSYQYRLLTVPLFEGLYLGASAEIGDYGAPLVPGNPSGTLYSGAAFLAFDSPIGPIYIGYGVGSGGNKSAYFLLGRP
jgi:NTE family protein